MLIVDEQGARSVLCSTIDNESFYCPPCVNLEHLVHPRQTLDFDMLAERCHRFAVRPYYVWLGPCGAVESRSHHLIKLLLAILVAQVAHVADLIEENAVKFMTLSITVLRLMKQFGDKFDETWSVLFCPLTPRYSCAGKPDIRKRKHAVPSARSDVSRRRSMVI